MFETPLEFGDTALAPDVVARPGARARQSGTEAWLESPLHAFDLPRRRRTPSPADGVWVSELAHLGHVTLRGRADDAAFMHAVSGVLGADLPTVALTVQACAAGVVLWVSPDEWLLTCRRDQRDALVARLDAALVGVHAQCVDSSGGLGLLRLAGARHLRLLRHLGPYDVERLATGRCVGTVMSKTSVTLIRTDTAGVLLLFRRSFADYVWRLVERAARPYGLCVTTPEAVADPLFTPLLQGDRP